MNAFSDTSADAEAAQLALLRQMTPSARWMMVVRLSADVADASKRAIRRTHPELSDVEVGQMFVELHYGRELADAMRQHQGSSADG